MSIDSIKSAIRDIPDFPQKGIIFKDITPVLSDAALFKDAVDIFAQRVKDLKVDKVCGIEARGFLFGAALAYKLGTGIVPIRKKGKLPYKCDEVSYSLEYGSATLQMHTDALKKGERVVLIDDLLATGGTAAASASMIERQGASIVAIQFLVELAFLNGRDRLTGHNVVSEIVY